MNITDNLTTSVLVNDDYYEEYSISDSIDTL